MPLDDKQRAYEQMADRFDEVMNSYDLRRRLEVVGELVGPSLNGQLVLDAGCGTGHFSRLLSQKGARVVSLDVGAKLVAQARAKAGSFPVMADAAQVPFADGTFDLVASSEMIEHTPDPMSTALELIRVLKPGGRFVLTTPNKLWHFAVVTANALGVRPYEGYENWISLKELARYTQAGGIQISHHFGFHLIPLFGNYLRPFDALGQVFPSLFVNQAIAGTK